jgi:ArsR family transcriptional regulator
MGLTKSEIFTEEQNRIATIAKVLGHPARIAILEFLIKLETCVCGDLVKDIGLAQPTISQHLKELKKVGLIKGKIEGTSICYCIDQKSWNKIKNTLNQFLNKNSVENCC